MLQNGHAAIITEHMIRRLTTCVCTACYKYYIAIACLQVHIADGQSDI